jgi:hypothetical protein
MYQRAISSKNPGCIVFLLDRSDSMSQEWRGGAETLAEGAAAVINDSLMKLCLRSARKLSGIAHYFDVGVFGYGLRPVAGGEGVESALGGKLQGRPLVALPDLGDNPLTLRKVSPHAWATTGRVPVWVEPVHGYRTPMCEAIAVAGGHVYEWASAHTDSFPPIIINITDGVATDSPYEGASLEEWAKRLTSIQTSDGPVLLYNIYLSVQGKQHVVPGIGPRHVGRGVRSVPHQ